MQRLAHTEGEIAVSRAAASKGLSMVLATHSTMSLEDVAMQGKGNPYAIHLLMLKDREMMEELLRRAERAGYKAVFLSADCLFLGFTGRGEFHGNKSRMAFDPCISWKKTIAWLREKTSLQIRVKGVSTPEDVQLAINHGVDGVLISNHGGRQLDGVPATLDALRKCAPVARGKIQIAVDGGIRRGSDIFKALAMGAQHVFLGRIPIWGLAYKSQAGVELAVDILLQELKLAMALAGCRSLSDINRGHLSFLQPDGRLARL